MEAYMMAHPWLTFFGFCWGVGCIGAGMSGMGGKR